MSTKNMKKQKLGSHRKKNAQKNKNAEEGKNDVLVFPPDLLQKLGINLENIQSPTNFLLENCEGTNDCSSVNSSQFQERNNVFNLQPEAKYEMPLPSGGGTQEKESSILETASLMKASVFLSPTFSSLKSNFLDTESNSEICIEQIIATTVDSIMSEGQDNNLESDSKKCSSIQLNNNCGDGTESHNVEPIYKDNIDNIVPVKASEKGTNKKNVPATKIKTVKSRSKRNQQNISSDIDDQLNKEKHYQNEDNFKTTQCNENFSKKIHKSSASCSSEEYCRKIDQSKKTSKVNEVQMKEVKLDSSLNVKLGLKKPKAKCGKNTNEQINQKEENIDKSDLDIHSALEYVSEIQNNPSSAMINKPDETCAKEELVNAQQTRHKHHNLKNSQIAKDLETSGYTCALNLKQSLTDVYKTSSESEVPLIHAEEIENSSNQICYSEPINGISMDKNINPSQSKGNSKLCIQGVEKPGGDRKSVHVHESAKTYSRRKTPKLCNTKSNNLMPFLEYNNDNEIDYIINDNENNTYTKGSYNFCLCHDFGSFISYEVNNNDYEHIHFWKRKDAQCSIETLFSIYKDTNVENAYTENDISILRGVENIDKENQFEISDDSFMGICWKDGETICNESKHEPIMTNQQKLIQEQDSDGCFVTTNEEYDHIETVLNKKRKRADKSSESDSDSEKPLAKIAAITFECGVCNTKVSSREWDHHISEEHCYIAWRKGQKIDLNNKDLLIKLDKRLNDMDILTCTFCKSELHDVGKFLKHIRKCKRARKTPVVTEISKLGKAVPATPLELEQKQVKIVDHKMVKESIPIVTVDEKQNAVSQVETQKQKPDVPFSLVETEVKKIAEVEIAEDQKQMKIERNDVSVLPVEIEERNVPETFVIQEGPEELQTFEVPLLEEKTVQQSPETIEVREKTTETKTFEVPISEVTAGDKSVICGVCKNVVTNDLWMEHIYQEHNYIAWKDGESPLDDDDDDVIRDYLNHIIKEIGELVCKKCGLKRKFAKPYLKHIQNCGVADQSNDTSLDQTLTPVTIKTEKEHTKNIKKTQTEKSKNEGTDNTEKVNQKNTSVRCGVCKLKLIEAEWIEHIFKEHDYLAWQEGHPEIDVKDSQQVHDHLYNILKQSGGLTCKTCGLQRRYVKSYLNHVKSCNSDTSLDKSVIESMTPATHVDELILELSKDEDAKCGVCKKDIPGVQWFKHVHLDHAYMAWKEGKTALNLEDEEEVQSYLYFLSKKHNGLVCHKCGLNRKYVKTYLNHVQSCDAEMELRSIIDDGISKKEAYKCAVCGAEVKSEDWTDHAMNVHYNIAWAVGDFPIDVTNSSAVERQLKEYRKRFGKLRCNTCRATRVSLMGFYAHIIQCGKTDEEIDQYKVYCDLCNSRYLGIYKSQHAIMHREKELSQQRKLMKEEAIKTEFSDSPPTEPLAERRRAAEKAREFIEKSQRSGYNCAKCGYAASNQEELDQHPCDKLNYKGYVESEDSVELESSGDETAESAVDSNLSDEENVWVDRRRKKNESSAARKVPRIPFNVKCPKSYVAQSGEEYCKLFLTNGTLYPQWRQCRIESVPDDEVAPYLPPLKESCKVIIGRSDPVIYNQFEAKKQNGYSVFVGGCIQCVSWAPPRADDERDELGHFLAVACHSDADLPRLDHTATYQYAGMLQIWDFGDLATTTPEFSLGIAHEYGTVWAMDWCPSGARDGASDNDIKTESSDAFLRLGLLAVACSNSFAYIFSVPYPSSMKSSDNKVFKLIPVAELRLSRGERVMSQATSINWSTQKGHTTVVVGYSNGVVATYNLECDSPLLTEVEDGVNVFYPFQDERPHSSCVTDVKTFPSSTGAGLMSSVSPTGSETVLYKGSARVHKHLPSATGVFAPHWPSLMLSGNDVIVNTCANELDLWGAGRRTGAVQTSCGCARCGHMATFVPPVLKLLTAHPAYPDFNKQPIAVFQMRPLSRKRTKHKNDELQVKLEPFNYQEAVKMYALDFKLLKDLDKEERKHVNRPRVQYPERFPLSDVPSMSFYPSRRHHRKLAAATHAGVIFILNDDSKL